MESINLVSVLLVVLICISVMVGFQLVLMVGIKKLLQSSLYAREKLLQEVKEKSHQTETSESFNDQLRSEMLRQLNETRSLGTTLKQMYVNKKSKDDGDDGR